MNKNVGTLEAFLRAALASGLPGPAAQRRFAPRPFRDDWAPELRPEQARLAAALLLIHPGPDGPTIPLTVRRDDLPHHPGQVSLPGGELEPGERAEAAAIREAWEEIGVAPNEIRMIGALSSVWIEVSNFVVQPFIAVTDAQTRFRAHPGEVASLIELRVADLRDRRRLAWASRSGGGLPLDYPYFEVGEKQVWGATAMMLGELACLFDPEHGPDPAAPPGE